MMRREGGCRKRSIYFCEPNKEKSPNHQTDSGCGGGRGSACFIPHLYLCMRYLVVSSNLYLYTLTYLFPRYDKIQFYSNRRQCFQGWSCCSTSGQCRAALEDSHTISLGREIEGAHFYICEWFQPWLMFVWGKYEEYLCTPAMGRSSDPLHYTQRGCVLLSDKSPLYKGRGRCCQGLTRCPTPAQWTQSLEDFHTRSLQPVTHTGIDATLQFSQLRRWKRWKEFDCTLTDHGGVLPPPHSTTDGAVPLPNIVVSIVTLVKHLPTHPGAVIPQHVSMREERRGAAVNLWGPKREWE